MKIQAEIGLSDRLLLLLLLLLLLFCSEIANFEHKGFFCVNQKDLLRFEPPLWPTPHV